MALLQILTRLVVQIERCNPTDDHGHDFKMNQAFIDAKVTVRMAMLPEFAPIFSKETMVIPDDLANLRGAIVPHDAILESEAKK